MSSLLLNHPAVAGSWLSEANMSVDLKVTHYDTGEDYFTFTIDRSVNYNLDEYELSQISYVS